MPTRDTPLLDHVALAVEDAAEAAASLEELGGQPLGGGEAPGFLSRQWLYPNGMKVELLEPLRVDENDFVRRFLDAHGPGAHHLTFRVPDLMAAVNRLESAGFPMLYVRTDNPEWKEAFIHPKSAFGTVVQLAEYPGESRDWDGHPCSVSVVAVDLRVHDLGGATRFYGDLLGGGRDDDERQRLGLPDAAVLLGWPGTGSLALVPAPDGELAGHSGRIARLVATRLHEEGCGQAGRPARAVEISEPMLGTPLTVLDGVG